MRVCCCRDLVYFGLGGYHLLSYLPTYRLLSFVASFGVPALDELAADQLGSMRGCAPMMLMA